MSDWKQKIEAQIAELQNSCYLVDEHGAEIGVSEHAASMQALLDVAVAAELYMKTSAASVAHHPREQKLFAALNKLREALRSESENKPLPVGPHDRSWCG